MSYSEPSGQLPPPRPNQWLPPSLARATPQAPPPNPHTPSAPGQNPYAQNPYAQNPYAQNPYASPAAQLPPRRKAGAVAGCLVLGLVPLLVVLLIVVGLLAGSRSTRERTNRPAPSSTTSQTAEVVWKLDAVTARPDLVGAQYVGSLDGAFDESYVRETAGGWLTLTGTEEAGSIALHAIDPATGKPRWQRELDGALCATSAAPTGILCASVLERDPRTKLGTRWRLHLLDPRTGQDRRTRDIDGWLTAVHRAGDSFVVLEQRQPAPHAALQAFGTDDLAPSWKLDLVGQPGQASMFSENRIIQRPEPERDGLALDRPRFRDVGQNLVAVWAGMRTAFVDRDSGRLVAMPHCSRLVDDGSRLWCNEVDGATAYSYAGRKLVRVTGPRLAFPRMDLSGTHRTRPVFIDSDGAGVSVDPRTGKVGRVYTPPGRGSAFGQVTMPGVYTAGGATFLIGAAGTLLLNPKEDKVTWRNSDIKVSDVPITLGDRVLLGNSRFEVVDLASGESQGRVSVADSHYVGLIGDRVVGSGPESISVVRIR